MIPVHRSSADGPVPVLVDWLAAHQRYAVPAVVILLLAAAAGMVARDATAARRHRRLAVNARCVRIAAPPQATREAGAALWTTLAGVLTPSRWQRLLYGTPHVAWEYTWSGRELTIRIWVPGTVPPGAAEAAVHAAWPGCTTTTEPATDPIPADVTVQAGGALWPQEAEVLPLRTDHDADPLRAMLAAGAGVGHREHACLQVLARPAHPRRVRAARASAAHQGSGGASDRATRAAQSTAQAAASLLTEPVPWLIDAFVPGGRRTGRTPSTASPAAARYAAARHDPVGEAHRRAVVDKARGVPHWQIGVRYAVASHAPVTGRDGGIDRQRRARQRDRMAGLAHSVASAAATYTRPNRLRRMRLATPVAVLAARRLRAGFLATVEELGALAALPQDLAVPGLDRARARAVAAPAAVPSGGRSVKVLGRAQVGGHAVGLPVTDARQHVHLIGKTGVGKSTLLLNLIMSDVHAGRGCVVIDPRGDLITDILDRLPDRFTGMGRKLAIIDPAQPNPACFNPLQISDGYGGEGGDAHLAVDNLVGIFAKIFARHWGPRMDDTLRVACLTLMRQPLPTLALIPPLLSTRAFRAPFTADLHDTEGLGGFWEWYDSMNDALRAQVIGPVLARLRAFLLRDFVRDVIGNPASSFSMREILDGGLLLCRLPKGVLGEETARILGSLIVARTWQAAIARAAIPEARRRDATLYVDECQNFLNLPGSVDDMLAEARGFRLGLVLAHQNLAQLPHETAAAVSANARTKLIFNVDPSDARELARHTGPELDEHDLARLDVHTAAARLLVGNRELPAFTMTTHPPADPLGHATAIRTATAAAHARPGADPVPSDDG